LGKSLIAGVQASPAKLALTLKIYRRELFKLFHARSWVK